MMEYGASMQASLESNVNLPFGGQATPGMVRGGSFALESLLQTMNAPMELTAMVVDMGFMEPLILNTLVELQSLPETTYEFVEMKDREFVSNSISLDDIRFDFVLAPDMMEKVRRSASESTLRISVYNEMIRGNPYFDQKGALGWAVAPMAGLEKLIVDDQTAEANIEKMKANADPERNKSPAVQGRQERGNGGQQG
jgi:hypothetical protein